MVSVTTLAMSPFTYVIVHPLISVIVLGGALLIRGVLHLLGFKEHRKTANWPTTTGKVTGVTSETRIHPNGIDIYQLNISFTYEVNGEHYGFFKFETVVKSSAIQVAAALDTNPVLVHYREADPLDSVLYDEELTALGSPPKDNSKNS